MSPCPQISRRKILGAVIAAPMLIAQSKAQTQTQTNEVHAMSQKIRFSFADQSFTATLNDSAASQDLIRQLPLALQIEDYATNEKIAYLPQKLTDVGAGPFDNASIGDLCYYAPWGNLVLYYGSYRYSAGLLRLGKLDGGITPLLTRGTFALSLTLI